jgi:hypothetical protein
LKFGSDLIILKLKKNPKKYAKEKVKKGNWAGP